MRPLLLLLSLALLASCGQEPEAHTFLAAREVLLLSEEGGCVRASEEVDLTQEPDFRAHAPRLLKVEPVGAQVYVLEARARPEAQATRVSGRFEVEAPGEEGRQAFATFQDAPLEDGQPLATSLDWEGSARLAALLLEPPYRARLHVEACPDAAPAAFRLQVVVAVRLLLRR